MSYSSRLALQPGNLGRADGSGLQQQAVTASCRTATFCQSPGCCTVQRTTVGGACGGDWLLLSCSTCLWMPQKDPETLRKETYEKVDQLYTASREEGKAEL